MNANTIDPKFGYLRIHDEASSQSIYHLFQEENANLYMYL